MGEGETPSQAGRVGGLAFVAGIGALAGLSLRAHRRAGSRALDAVVGGALLVGSEVVARRRQRPGEIPPLWHRIVASAALASPLGWAAGRFTAAGPVAVGTGAGAVTGAMRSFADTAFRSTSASTRPTGTKAADT